MSEIIVSLLLLTLIFSVASGVTLLLRRGVLKNRAKIMSVIWAAVLLASVFPIRNQAFDLKSAGLFEQNNVDSRIEWSEMPTDSKGILPYSGNYAELTLIQRLYHTQALSDMVPEENLPESFERVSDITLEDVYLFYAEGRA